MGNGGGVESYLKVKLTVALVFPALSVQLPGSDPLFVSGPL